MSAQRRKIEAAAKAKGYVIESIDWQPIGGMIEMVGRDGGWTVFARNADRHVMACGYNADAVVAHIAELWEQAWKECDRCAGLGVLGLMESVCFDCDGTGKNPDQVGEPG